MSGNNRHLTNMNPPHINVGMGSSRSDPHFLEPSSSTVGGSTTSSALAASSSFASALARSASLGARRKGSSGAPDDIERGIGYGPAGTGYGMGREDDYDVENGDGTGFDPEETGSGSRWGFGGGKGSSTNSGYGSTRPVQRGAGYDPAFSHTGGGGSNLPYMGDAPILDNQHPRSASYNRRSFAVTSPTSPGSIPPPSAGGNAATYGYNAPPHSTNQSARQGYSPSAMSGSVNASPYMQGSVMSLDEPPHHSLPSSNYEPQGTGGWAGKPQRQPLGNRNSSSDMSSPRTGGLGLPSSHVPAKRERNSSGSSAGTSSVMNMTGIEQYPASSPIGQFSTSPLIGTPASVPGSTHPLPGVIGGPRQALTNRSRSSQQLNSQQRSAGQGLHLQPSAMGPSTGIASAPGMTGSGFGYPPTGESTGYEMTGLGKGGNTRDVKRMGLRRISDPTKDIRPSLDSQPGERRADPDVPGAFLSVSVK
jgi:hypothetical protein